MQDTNNSTEKQFQEILKNIYDKGQESNINVTDVINEIKAQMIAIMNK